MNGTLNDAHKHIPLFQKACKNPLAKPHLINTQYSPSDLFQKMWIVKQY